VSASDQETRDIGISVLNTPVAVNGPIIELKCVFYKVCSSTVLAGSLNELVSFMCRSSKLSSYLILVIYLDESSISGFLWVTNSIDLNKFQLYFAIQ